MVDILLWFALWPWDDGIQAGDETSPLLVSGVAVVEDVAVDDVANNDVADGARLGVWERDDELDGGEGDGLFDGADWADIAFFGG